MGPGTSRDFIAAVIRTSVMNGLAPHTDEAVHDGYGDKPNLCGLIER